MNSQSNPVSIEDVPINKFHQLMTVRSGGGWVMDGYILSIIGVGLIQVSAYLGLTNFWEGMIAASALLGIFVGGFLGGSLTSTLGRRKLYFIGPAVFLVASVAQFWVESALVLFLLRFLIGIGVGFEYPVAGSLLAEFLPKKSRGPRLAVLTVLWFAGAALAYIIGTAILSTGHPDAWRWVLVTPAVIGLFLLLVRLGTPESPRWLISKGRDQEAEAVIKKVYGDSFSLANLPEEPDDAKATFLDLFRSGYGKRMLFVVAFWTCSVTPVFAVYAFVPQVLGALNLSEDAASYGSVVITVMFFVGCVVATFLINTWGRRPLVIHSFLWSMIALVALGIFDTGAEWLILLLFGAYAVFIGGAQILQLVYPNEIFPTEVRTVAVGMGASLSRVGAAIGTFLVPISLSTIGISGTMFAAAAISLIGLIASVWLAPETRGLNLADAASLGSRKAAKSN